MVRDGLLEDAEIVSNRRWMEPDYCSSGAASGADRSGKPGRGAAGLLVKLCLCQFIQVVYQFVHSLYLRGTIQSKRMCHLF